MTRDYCKLNSFISMKCQVVIYFYENMDPETEADLDQKILQME